MTERIVAAALRAEVAVSLREEVWNGERVYPDHLIISAARPARHSSLLHPLGRRLGQTEQGFLTSEGNFATREEALALALIAGQVTEPTICQGLLFSEDLW